MSLVIVHPPPSLPPHAVLRPRSSVLGRANFFARRGSSVAVLPDFFPSRSQRETREKEPLVKSCCNDRHLRRAINERVFASPATLSRPLRDTSRGRQPRARSSTTCMIYNELLFFNPGATVTAAAGLRSPLSPFVRARIADARFAARQLVPVARSFERRKPARRKAFPRGKPGEPRSEAAREQPRRRRDSAARQGSRLNRDLRLGGT